MMPDETRFRQLMDTAPVLIWSSNAEGRCTYFNKVWLDFTGRTTEQEHGCGWAAGVHPEDYERCAGLYAGHFKRHERFRMEYRLRRKDGEWRWLLGTGVPRFDPAGTFLGFIGSCIDITEMKEAAQQRQRDLDEKAALLQELHHRVKNNTQVFASLLTMQANRADDPVVQAALHTAASRASAMAVAQQQIHDAGTSAEFDLSSFVRSLVRALGATLPLRIEVEVAAPRPVLVPLTTAVPLGLIMHELLTNAVRHAFPEGRAGRVEIGLRRGRRGALGLSVRDDGVGMPEGVSLEAQRSAGWTIVKSLARQLGAKLTVKQELGTRVRLLLPARV